MNFYDIAMFLGILGLILLLIAFVSSIHLLLEFSINGFFDSFITYLTLALVASGGFITIFSEGLEHLHDGLQKDSKRIAKEALKKVKMK